LTRWDENEKQQSKGISNLLFLFIIIFAIGFTIGVFWGLSWVSAVTEQNQLGVQVYAMQILS